MKYVSRNLFKIDCKDCDAIIYVGKTGLEQNYNSVSNYDYVKSLNCSFNFDVASILYHESNTSQRRFSESCFIQLDKNSIDKRNDTPSLCENY